MTPANARLPLYLLACLALNTHGRSAPQADPAGVAPSVAQQLFTEHCATCHGANGHADGDAATFLLPPARDFSRGTFRLVSSHNGAPLESDLVATIRRGVPGSCMPAFPWLDNADLVGLARHVRKLSTEGLAQRLQREALARSCGDSASSILIKAERQLKPDRPLADLPASDTSEEARYRGRELYMRRCAACHGEDGSGTETPRWNDDGEVNWARNFTAGYLKGGSTRQDIAHRIQAGMPGSAMPATHLENPADMAALVDHVMALLPGGRATDISLRHGRVTARRVESLADVSHHSASWTDIEPLQVQLSPLWWKRDSIVRVTLRAMHDGEQLAIRVRWADSTCSPRISDDAQRSDGLALQFSTAMRPPLFGMGNAEHPTDIWHWKSLRLAEVAGWMDLLDPGRSLDSGGTPEIRTDASVGQRLDGLEPVSRQVEFFHGRGLRDARPAVRSASTIKVLAEPTGTAWDLIFVRALGATGARDVRFEPGGELQVAIAVWNGAAGDRGPQKSISIWQTLRLEP